MMKNGQTSRTLWNIAKQCEHHQTFKECLTSFHQYAQKGWIYIGKLFFFYNKYNKGLFLLTSYIVLDYDFG